MVFKFQFQLRTGISLLAIVSSLISAPAWAGPKEDEALSLASRYFREGKFFRSARYGFDALSGSQKQRAEAYYQITRSLMQAGLFHSASYFFVRTLQTGNSESIQAVLQYAEPLILDVGLDLMRDYFIRHTEISQYGPRSRAAYLYASGKRALLASKHQQAIAELSQISSSSALYPFALQLRATAKAILGDDKGALKDFRACESRASSITTRLSGDEVTDVWRKQRARQVDDLRNRCQAGVARTLYQMEQFSQADVEYDSIPKRSFVWTDILFEQAWNAYSKKEYNRTLGKLVSYKSPALSFVHNSEIPVLRALSYLALCLYNDANTEVARSLPEMDEVGRATKRFLTQNQKKLIPFYEAGKNALQDKLHTKNSFNKLLNRFVRAPYFHNLVDSERAIGQERKAVAQFAKMHAGTTSSSKQGFPGFLNLVLDWRTYTLAQLGGAFVRNSMLDYYEELVRDAENLNFIKIEMLSRFKDKLRFGKVEGERERGHVIPSRRDDQYYWSFNGEFWNDEIGDYVFALDSECRK